ncbi:type II toxin-antitoxin system PemK/MazF family toxin [Palaeococcus sp. (in: euryarchaeotes)]
MELFQREIVLLPFPFDDLTKAKTRPALIVSSDEFNKISRTVIVVEITSNLKSGFQEYNVIIGDNNVRRYPKTKPIIPSIVKPYVIFAVNKRLIIKKIGALEEDKFKEVIEKLKRALNIL